MSSSEFKYHRVSFVEFEIGCSDVENVPENCGKDGAEAVGEVLDLQLTEHAGRFLCPIWSANV